MTNEEFCGPDCPCKTDPEPTATNAVIFRRLDNTVPKPVRAHATDAGVDLTAHRLCLPNGEMASFQVATIKPGDTLMFGTGIAAAVPPGQVGLLFARSSIGVKRRLDPANAVGVIDPGYRGEIMVSLRNTSTVAQAVQQGERICQMVVPPVNLAQWVEADTLTDTERGDGGFGSTGIH